MSALRAWSVLRSTLTHIAHMFAKRIVPVFARGALLIREFILYHKLLAHSKQLLGSREYFIR